MTKAEFETRLQKLLSAHARETSNVRCLQCEGCERCTESTFCTRGSGLVRCHYCDGSSDCTDSSHLVRCKGCLASQHCTECERCTQCAYLVRCVGMSGCTYCFGCVGLSRKDFHILNEPYERQEYFDLSARLSRELGQKDGASRTTGRAS
jgi:hypothetical protein